MTRYDLALFSGASRLPLPTNRARGVSASTGPRGFQDLTAFLPLSDAQADQLALAPGLRATLSDGGGVIWQGRVEDQGLRNGGVQLGALGDARGLDDVRYTALWSDTSVEGWEPTLTTQIANRNPDQYEIDTQNRLFIGLQKNTTYANGGGSGVGSLYYETPRGGGRNIVTTTFDYAVLLPVGFQLLINGYTNSAYDFSGGVIAFGPLVGTGALLTGSGSITPGSYNQLEMYIFNNSGVNITYAGENGTNYARLTNVRVKSTASTTLTADEIVRALRDYVNTVNPGALSTSNRLIVSPGIDLLGETYEDMTPAQILDRLDGYGNSSGQPYEWGVFEGKELYFRPRGSAARQWAIDAADLEVEQSLEGLINSTYATYQDAAGRDLRTAAQTNAQSIARYGLTRQAVIDVDTTSGATAATVAATSTAATATPVPRSKVMVRRFSTLAGAPARGEEVRAGDTVTIRNLPPTLNTAIDRIRTFRVAQTRFDLDTGAVEIIPESPAPDVEFQIAFVLKALKG